MTEHMALPTECGVVGGGTMGAGIAHAFLVAGSTVVLVERDEAAAVAARDRVNRAVRAGVERGKIESEETTMSRLDTVATPARLATAQLVVEAVPENLELKRKTLAAIEVSAGASAVIATNTSSISLGRLSATMRHPERLIGLHFFNPVPSSKLIEVVVAETTDPELVPRAQSWIRALDKTPITVRDSPGFASSRLGVALGLEAIRMLEEGVATAEDIDTAMVLGYGHPMGPLKLTDLVGLDVRLGIARYLAGELGERFAPPKLMVDMVERGDLGRKSGRGFYDWNTGGV